MGDLESFGESSTPTPPTKPPTPDGTAHHTNNPPNPTQASPTHLWTTRAPTHPPVDNHRPREGRALGLATGLGMLVWVWVLVVRCRNLMRIDAGGSCLRCWLRVRVSVLLRLTGWVMRWLRCGWSWADCWRRWAG